MQLEALKANKFKTSQTTKRTRDERLNKTLKGVLINNHIANQGVDSNISFDEIRDSLLIVNKKDETKNSQELQYSNEQSSFNAKKAIKPLLISTGVLFLGSLALSLILKSSSKLISKSKSFECLPDLAINNNIKQEPQFAIYRALRDPSSTNIFAAAAVFIFSGITIASKNFVDGLKEIWLKKKSADIEKNLQEKLIQVETDSFSGKLKVVNDLMYKNLQYFESKLNANKNKLNEDIFSDLISFKGSSDVNQQNNIETSDKQKKEETKNNMKYILLASGIVATAFLVGSLSIKNIKEAADETKKLSEFLKNRFKTAINKQAESPNKDDLPKIIDWLKNIYAEPEYIKEVGKKYGLSNEKIQSIINEVEAETQTIFADAPTALGGIPKKLQYYCYIDENRGHLYNWLLHKENKFTKYIFLSFTISSAIGYMFKQAMDAIKDATVMKENAKTELNLKKRLVDVEIRNFKAKKESAVNPLIDNFTQQADLGEKSKEELKQLADNILTEIKNGPPYVYT